MAFIHYPTKRAARRAQRTWLLGAAQFGVLTEILGAVPHAVVGRASSGIIATAMGYLAVEAGHAAEDPPRSDFRTSTRARRRRLPTDKLGDTALERQTAQFGDAAGYGAAYLAAFVRAVERSQRAEEVNAYDAIAQRISEADAYARRAADSLRQTSEGDLPLAQALQADVRLRQIARQQFRGRAGQELIDTPFWEKLSPRILELFREAHVDPQSLRSDWDNRFPDDPIASCVRTLRLAAESSDMLADGLVAWGPTLEKPQTPAFQDEF
jgi:hypothetical protein